MSISDRSELLRELKEWKQAGLPFNRHSHPPVVAHSEAYYLLSRLLDQQEQVGKATDDHRDASPTDCCDNSIPSSGAESAHSPHDERAQEERKALADMIARDRADIANETERRRQAQEQAKPIARIRQALGRMRSYGGPVDTSASADADWVERLADLYETLADAGLLRLLDALPDRGEVRRFVLPLLRWAGAGQRQLALDTLAEVAPLGKLDAALATELTYHLPDDLVRLLPDQQSALASDVSTAEDQARSLQDVANTSVPESRSSAEPMPGQSTPLTAVPEVSEAEFVRALSDPNLPFQASPEEIIRLASDLIVAVRAIISGPEGALTPLPVLNYVLSAVGHLKLVLEEPIFAPESTIWTPAVIRASQPLATAVQDIGSRLTASLHLLPQKLPALEHAVERFQAATKPTIKKITLSDLSSPPPIKMGTAKPEPTRKNIENKEAEQRADLTAAQISDPSPSPIPLEGRAKAPVEVFFSYSHKDEKLRDKLATHLSLLKHEQLIADWHDRKIGPGTEWQGQIDQHLNSARLILLLVSADFLASPYCYGMEMKRAVARHEAGEARVIPVILRPCDWHGAPFGKLQALPTDGKPVTDWKNRDKAFTDIARGIRAAVADLTARP